MPICLFCLFSRVLVLICPSVLVRFCYIQKVRSDWRMPKFLELHWTDTTGWFLFRLVEGVYPTMMAENSVLNLKGHWWSVPWNFLLPLMLHFCGVCLVVPVLFAFCINPVLLFSGLLTLHCPICAFWELFILFAVLASLFDMLAWVPHPCDSWWDQLVLHCCQCLPLPWCTCFLVASVLGTSLSSWRRQYLLLRICWCIRHKPCVLVVLLFWEPWGECV